MKALDYDGLDHVVDKIYDLMNGGGSADYIVDEGTATVGACSWTYRKWASGLAELWGYVSTSVASYASLGNYGYAYYLDVNYPFTLTGVTSIQSNTQVATQLTDSMAGGDNLTTTVRLYAKCPLSGTQTFKSRVYITGTWRTFVPSVSATNTQVGFEDFSSRVTVNSKLTLNSSYLFIARRIGKIAFICFRGTTNAQMSSANTDPLLTLPHVCEYQLGGILFYGGASSTRPLIRVEGNKVYQQWTSTIASGVIIEFWCAYIVQS